jgi:hypothetical protein
VLRQNGYLPGDRWQFTIIPDVKIKGNLARSGFFRFGNILEILPIKRMVFPKGLKAEYYIINRNRLAVMPSCPITQPESGGSKIRRIRHPLGYLAITGRRFPQAGVYQAFINKSYAFYHITFMDEDIQIIERSPSRKFYLASFGSFRVHVIEMAEICRIFQIAYQRYAMPANILSQCNAHS